MKEDRSFCRINSIRRGRYVGALDFMEMSGVCDAIKLEVTVEKKRKYWPSPDRNLSFLKEDIRKV